MMLTLTDNGSPIGEIHVAEAGIVNTSLNKLTGWVNEALAKKDLHPLLVAAMFIAYLQAAPFKEANMGVARFVVMLILMKGGYTYAPYASLGPLMEDKGEEIYKALKANQASLEEGKPDWSVWMAELLGVLQDQKALLYRRLYSRESEIKHMAKLSAKIMGRFRHHQRLQMKEIMKLTNGRRATIKIRLQELVEGGYLHRYGAGRSTWYALV